jgi:hypothetical protein
VVSYKPRPLHPVEKAAIRNVNGTLWSPYPGLMLCKRENFLSPPENEIELLDFPTYTEGKTQHAITALTWLKNPTQQKSAARQTAHALTPANLTSH